MPPLTDDGGRNEIARIRGSADQATANALRATIRTERANILKTAFRTAFRAEATRIGAANAALTDLGPVNDKNNFLIDQFNHDGITAVQAVAAYNQG